MLVIHVHDEHLARQIEQIAARENLPVEEILRAMVEHYPAETPVEGYKSDKSDSVKRIRRKAYVKAREYWQQSGDFAKAAMSDETLDDQFGAFDEEGIPRLKSELTSSEPPPGSLAYAAKIIREMGGVRTNGALDVSKADQLLDEEFADYLRNRTRDEDATK